MTQPYLSQLQTGAQKHFFLHRLTFPPPPCLGQAPAASKTATLCPHGSLSATLCPQGSLSAGQMNRGKCYRATGGEPQATWQRGPRAGRRSGPRWIGVQGPRSWKSSALKEDLFLAKKY